MLLNKDLVSHDFHIPVMGIGFSIDTPIKVAPFGIDSVISLAGDNTIELIRKHYYDQLGLEYKEILNRDYDSRARRITDYLNLVNTIVDNKFSLIQQSSFDDVNNDLNKTFQLLSPSHPMRNMYNSFKKDPSREDLKLKLKNSLNKGSIDVNIMTKLDLPFSRDANEKLQNDAMAALRGFANSELDSSIIFSAGINFALYSYLPEFADFLPDKNDYMKKKVILKVSDLKSMVVQGKFLAKKGIWVSEYRIESGLNCGGHGFGNPNGQVGGSIIFDVMNKKDELYFTQLDLFNNALKSKGLSSVDVPSFKITYQGGIKTFAEKKWFLDNGVDRVGIATPFLFVPEATHVSDDTLEILTNAKEKDIVLSKASPLGVPFWLLKGTKGNIMHDENIKEGTPGVVCTYAHLKSPYNEKLLCRADYTRINSELKNINLLENISKEKKEYLEEKIVAPHCLCPGLAYDMVNKLNLEGDNFKKTTDDIICPGPSAVHFDGTYSLLEMVQHFNGENILIDNVPNTHIEELRINIDKLTDVLSTYKFEDKPENILKQSQKISAGLNDGVAFYRANIASFEESKRPEIISQLNFYENKLSSLNKKFFS